jgi:hypothetical protein
LAPVTPEVLDVLAALGTEDEDREDVGDAEPPDHMLP